MAFGSRLVGLHLLAVVFACWGICQVTGQLYEGYDPDGNYAAMYAFIVCEANPDGAGLQSIPTDIAARTDGKYDKICAVSESDEFVVIRAGVYVVREDAGNRKKRDAELPHNVMRLEPLGSNRVFDDFVDPMPRRRNKRQGAPPIDFSYIVETGRDYDNVDTDRDAKAGLDYEHVSIVWTFHPTPGGYAFRVPIIDDENVEKDELFQVNFSDLIQDFTYEGFGGQAKRAIENQYPSVKILIVDDDVNFQFSSLEYLLNQVTGGVTFSIHKEAGSMATSVTSLTVTAEEITDDDSAAVVKSMDVVFSQSGSQTIQETMILVNVEDSRPPQAFKLLITSHSKGVVVQPSEALVLNLQHYENTNVVGNPSSCSCLNNGHCADTTNECWCPDGFTGSRCENSLCNPSCVNGGQCSSIGKCLCLPGYSGSQCHLATATGTIADPSVVQELCPADYCRNDGVCTADTIAMTSSCRCTSQYSGSQCQNGNGDGASSGSSGILSGIGIALAAIALITVIILSLYLLGCRGNPQMPTLPNVQVPSHVKTVETLDLAPYPYSAQRPTKHQQTNPLMY